MCALWNMQGMLQFRQPPIRNNHKDLIGSYRRCTSSYVVLNQRPSTPPQPWRPKQRRSIINYPSIILNCHRFIVCYARTTPLAAGTAQNGGLQPEIGPGRSTRPIPTTSSSSTDVQCTTSTHNEHSGNHRGGSTTCLIRRRSSASTSTTIVTATVPS